MPKGTSINANVYANTLDKLRKAIDQKRADFFNREVFLLHDNATVHKLGQLWKNAAFWRWTIPPAVRTKLRLTFTSSGY
jgi:hypothetical protein